MDGICILDDSHLNIRKNAWSISLSLWWSHTVQGVVETLQAILGEQVQYRLKGPWKTAHLHLLICSFALDPYLLRAARLSVFYCLS